MHGMIVEPDEQNTFEEPKEREYVRAGFQLDDSPIIFRVIDFLEIPRLIRVMVHQCYGEIVYARSSCSTIEQSETLECSVKIDMDHQIEWVDQFRVPKLVTSFCDEHELDKPVSYDSETENQGVQ